MRSKIGSIDSAALLLIDLQNDFVDGGALAVRGGVDVIAVANRLMPLFQSVWATQDWHPVDHQSFASQHPGIAVGDQLMLGGLPQTVWPDHCVAGSPGARFVDGLRVDQIDHIVAKGTNRNIDSYSGFYDNQRQHSTGLSDQLRNAGIENLFIMGLATDYCVHASVLDAISEGFHVTIILDGCRGVDLNPGDVERSIDEMIHAGAAAIRSGDLFDGDDGDDDHDGVFAQG